MSKREALKNYVQVKDRIKQFRAEHPDYDIDTHILEREDDYCLMRAEILDAAGRHLASGHSLERTADNVMVNRTSLVENCETSAVGRALAMLGYGIDQSVASAEEIARTKKNFSGTDQDNALLRRVLRAQGITDTDLAGKIHSSLREANVLADEAHIFQFIKEFTK